MHGNGIIEGCKSLPPKYPAFQDTYRLFPPELNDPLHIFKRDLAWILVFPLSAWARCGWCWCTSAGVA